MGGWGALRKKKKVSNRTSAGFFVYHTYLRYYFLNRGYSFMIECANVPKSFKQHPGILCNKHGDSDPAPLFRRPLLSSFLLSFLRKVFPPFAAILQFQHRFSFFPLCRRVRVARPLFRPFQNEGKEKKVGAERGKVLGCPPFLLRAFSSSPPPPVSRFPSSHSRAGVGTLRYARPYRSGGKVEEGKDRRVLLAKAEPAPRA